MPEAPEPVIEPVDDDGVSAAVVGLGLWAIGLVACLILRDTLADRGAQWWTWSCVAGLGLGAILLWFTRRRAAVYRAHRAQQAPESDAG